MVDEEIWSFEDLSLGGEAASPVFSKFCKGAEELRFSHATMYKVNGPVDRLTN